VKDPAPWIDGIGKSYRQSRRGTRSTDSPSSHSVVSASGEATRHYYRNVQEDVDCGEGEEAHVDGDELADTVLDIWSLIRIIERMNK
jgi:hypothetical protein